MMKIRTRLLLPFLACSLTLPLLSADLAKPPQKRELAPRKR